MMAKTDKKLTADERVEVETLEAAVVRDEARASFWERTAPPTTAEPTDTPETPAQCFLKDAREAQAVFAAGNPISPDVLKALVGRAIGLLDDAQSP